MIWYAITRSREAESRIHDKWWALQMYGWNLTSNGTPYYETDDVYDRGLLYAKQLPGVFVLPKNEIPAKMLIKQQA